MAIEEGLVMRASGLTAWVKTNRSSSCEHCQSKDSCQTMGGGDEAPVEALNPIKAVAGDQVVISFDTASLLKGAFLIYMVPILALLAGAGAGVKLSEILSLDRSVMSAIIGLAALLLSFFYVRAQGNRLAQLDAYKPKIIRIKRVLPAGESAPFCPNSDPELAE